MYLFDDADNSSDTGILDEIEDFGMSLSLGEEIASLETSDLCIAELDDDSMDSLIEDADRLDMDSFSRDMESDSEERIQNILLTETWESYF